jgi:hypothetical protein
MTLERAVEILNREKHRGTGNWEIARVYKNRFFVTIPDRLIVVAFCDQELHEPDAIAVALKYEPEQRQFSNVPVPLTEENLRAFHEARGCP